MPEPEPQAEAFAETVPEESTWRQRVPTPPALEMTKAEVEARLVTAKIEVVAKMALSCVVEASEKVAEPKVAPPTALS